MAEDDLHPDLAEYLKALDLDDQQELLRTSFPESVLSTLLLTLSNPSSRHFPRYGDYITTHSPHSLLSSLRPELFKLFDTPNATLTPSSLSSLPKPSFWSLSRHAIYLHVIHLPQNKVYCYVGQTNHLSSRIQQHQDFRYRRDHPSYHAYAMDRSSSDSFFVLATVDYSPSGQTNLALNILEMYCALLLRTLPASEVDGWLNSLASAAEPTPSANGDAPASPAAVSWHPLNIALPIDQGLDDPILAATAIALLNTPDADDLAKEYYAALKSGIFRRPVSPQVSSPWASPRRQRRAVRTQDVVIVEPQPAVVEETTIARATDQERDRQWELVLVGACVGAVIVLGGNWMRMGRLMPRSGST
jgi:hypothetical protein